MVINFKETNFFFYRTHNVFENLLRKLLTKDKISIVIRAFMIAQITDAEISKEMPKLKRP